MQPVLLVVMDGVGLRDEKNGNAFLQAETPNLDSLMSEGYEELKAWGSAVGLPEGFQGNSEVGHLHLGAGRRISQRLERINKSIENNGLRQKKALKQSLERAELNKNDVHLAGIISDGGIHGHIDHLKALMDITTDYDLEKVWIHCFTDGRDVDPKSASKYIEQIREKMHELETDFDFGSIMGRYYAMDRDHNWDRTEKAYKAIALGEGFEFSEPEEAVEKTYDEEDYDYFTIPGVNECYNGMNTEDELIFYNYRADRERQIVRALLKEDFGQFDNPVNPNLISMFPYHEDFDNPVIFNKTVVENTLGQKIDEAGLKQLRVTESQKIPHMTYFFNGQREIQFENEDREFVESDKIKAYDEKPEMHARDITEIVIEALSSEEHDFIIMNFPNGDLVGHTGDLKAAITAMETVDRNIGKLVEVVGDTEYALLITADHGNCEQMGSEEKPSTSHTLNRVPFITYNLDSEIEFEEKELWEIEKVVENVLEL